MTFVADRLRQIEASVLQRKFQLVIEFNRFFFCFQRLSETNQVETSSDCFQGWRIVVFVVSSSVLAGIVCTSGKTLSSKDISCVFQLFHLLCRILSSPKMQELAFNVAYFDLQEHSFDKHSHSYSVLSKVEHNRNQVVQQIGSDNQFVKNWQASVLRRRIADSTHLLMFSWVCH